MKGTEAESAQTLSKLDYCKKGGRHYGKRLRDFPFQKGEDYDWGESKPGQPRDPPRLTGLADKKREYFK